MLTERDGKIMSWLREYKAITVNQATHIFFSGCYEGCRRRLKQLSDNNILKSYNLYEMKDKIYYLEKRIKYHDIVVRDLIKEICKRGGEIWRFKTNPYYMNGDIIPDAFIEFKLNNNLYFILLEVDATHFTSAEKMQRYEKLYKTMELQNQCYGVFPLLLIARPTLNDVRYNSKNFDVIYTDMKYSNLDKFLFNIPLRSL